jgi:CoA:oxalate CoA-transferase
MHLDHFLQRGVIAAGTVGSPIRTSTHPPLPPGPIAALDQHHGQGWH